MSQELIPSDQKLWQLIKRYFDGDPSIAPYVQEINLLESHIAGTGYLDLKEIEPEIHPGDLLLFRRELDNEHDRLAIIILD